MAEERLVERSEQTLKRGIMPWHVSLIALGGIIGSCYFLELGYTFNEMGPGAILITYAVAGITIYGVMQSFAELLVNIPRRGSFVSYTREFMGDTASAGIGWAFWANWVCYIPSEALATAIFVNALIKQINPEFVGNAGLTFLWGIIALVLLTLINIFQVKWFGHLESILAIIKIFAIILFIIAGILIFLGIVNGNGAHFEGNGATADIAAGFVGTQAILPNVGEDIMHQLFPRGGVVMITLMIWTLVNFQGSEIVGLSAAETQNPEVNVPAACKKVAYRIILIYLVPIFILSLIMPYTVATLDSSVFAQALAAYGWGWASSLFTVVTLVAAFSCANSGFYGTVRSLYGLSVEGLAPKFLSKLNRHSTPQNATLFTLVFIWVVFMLSFFISILGYMGGEDNMLYTALVGIAGFTGTLCWVGILYSQILFRKKLKERGYDPKEVLTVKAALFPVLGWFAIILQVAAMVLLIFEAGDGIPIFLLSMDIIIAPVAVFAVQKYRGKIRKNIVIGTDEVTFNEKFPAKPGSEGERKDAVKASRKLIYGGGTIWTAIIFIVTAVSIALSFLTINANPAEIAEGYNILTDPAMGKVWLLMLVEIVTYVIVFFSAKKLGERTAVKEDAA
ncbi:MAG: amino acid permease [Clostridiales Family XIII bacterium]|jgi:AAT family amino acid transporter|nr:amino acid permease [Clostridiales Family XIII bacterium]